MLAQTSVFQSLRNVAKTNLTSRGFEPKTRTIFTTILLLGCVIFHEIINLSFENTISPAHHHPPAPSHELHVVVCLLRSLDMPGCKMLQK
jgi:hypothetical protein